ncbi:ABC transporter permease [bacteria symbiont BFo1 of Frankliniella occidentalis]|nr:ABC transporter permease [bacteria symbiont BFo1 of Frankliniella occidentalis]
MSLQLERLWQGLLDTLMMVGASSLAALLLGLPLAVILVITDRNNLFANPLLNRLLGWVVNLFRSVPFLILMVALIPFTRLVVGTSYGVWAAVVPLTLAATPFFARIAEVSLREVDKGLVEAAHIAYRYGYQRFDSQVMLTVIIVLVALVTVLQLCGDRLSRHLNHR